MEGLPNQSLQVVQLRCFFTGLMELVIIILVGKMRGRLETTDFAVGTTVFFI